MGLFTGEYTGMQAVNANDERYWSPGMYGPQSTAGKIVNAESAMRQTTVWACGRILSGTVASLPCHLYQSTNGDDRERARSHSLYQLLRDEPNPNMDAFTFFSLAQQHLTYRGNFYAQQQRNGAGDLVALWPWHPDAVRVEQADNWDITYILRDRNGNEKRFAPHQVFHVQGLLSDGLKGISPLETVMIDPVGFALATDEYGATFFKNGGRPPMILELDKFPGVDQLAEMQKGFQSQFSGSNLNKTAVMWNGKAHVVGVKPEEAQFLETRKYQIADIARIFNMQLHLLALLDKATFSNIEHQSIEFVMHTIRPWLKCWEAAIQRQLLVGKERESYYAEFLIDDLLRGDIKTRFEAYALAITNGFMNRNEVRARENLNRVEGLDNFLEQLNMGKAGRPSESDALNNLVVLGEALHTQMPEIKKLLETYKEASNHAAA